MSRNISPPPAKRRTDGQETTYLPSTPSSACVPPVPNGTSMLRIFSWNINGTAPFLQTSITAFFQAPRLQSNKAQGTKAAISPASLRGFLQRHDWPAILLLQEVKIPAKDKKTQDAVRAAVNSRLPSESGSGTDGPMYEAHFTLPTDLYNARGLRGSGKVYGICSIFRRDLREIYQVNVREVSWDNEGRISVVELECASAKLALFNIYAVSGTDNPYRNPVTRIIQGTRHDRKLDFRRLLREECVDREKADWLVLLDGDMNVAPDARDGHPRLRNFPVQHVLNREDFHDKILVGKTKHSKGFNGVDIWRRMHGNERRYTYFSPSKEWGSSCDRVDYVIAGRKAWNSGIIKACGIMDSEVERGPSDHVPIWVDIQLKYDNSVLV